MGLLSLLSDSGEFWAFAIFSVVIPRPGLGIHDFLSCDGCKLVDAKAKPWHDD
jgi:hypothetical protein